jgi:hypothetical protein
MLPAAPDAGMSDNAEEDSEMHDDDDEAAPASEGASLCDSGGDAAEV